MATEADSPEEESHMKRDGEDSFLTTRQFKITDNENSTEEFKRSEGQLNQDPGNLECLKESEIRQVSSNAHVEDMNGVNSCNFETSKGEGFLELPGPPKVADDKACGLVHCQTDEINQSEISENLKHPQAGQHHGAVEDTRREYFEVMGEKNKSEGEKKVHHILNATENMLQIEYTGELGLVVEKEENTKNDIGLDEYVEFNTDQKIFNKEIQLRIQKETSDLDKDKKGASIEDKHSDLSSNQVLSVPETTLEQKNEALVHIPKFTVCDLGMGIRSVTQGCAKEENTDNFSIAHAALEPGKERSSEGINSKKAERSFDFVGGEECLKAVGCREDKITKKDDNEKITDHSTKDGSILTKAASQDTRTGEKVTFEGEDTVDEQIEKKPAIDGSDISIEEEVAIEREKKHTDAPATVYNEKSQDTTESNKQLNSHLAQNEVQDKDSSVTLSITDIEDKCSLQVDNPQMPKIYPGTTSELDALEKYVHKKGQELETMEALAEEAIHKEASISPVTSKDNEMDAEKLTREESNTKDIEEHDNGLLLVSIQDGATKTSNDEENDTEKPHKVIVDESELHTAGESIPCERDGDVLHEECTYLDPLDTSTEEKGVVNTVSSREAKDDNINKVKAIENNVNAESKCHEQTTQEDESEGKLDEKVLPFLSGEVVAKPSGYAKGITCTKKKEAIWSLEETLELEKKENTAIVNNANDTEEVELEISCAEQETKEQIFEKIDLVKSPCPIFSDKDPIDEHTNQDQEFTALETSCSSKNIGKENSEEQGAIDEIYYPLIKEDKKISKEYKDNEMSLKEEKQESHLEKEKDISIVLSVKIFEEMCSVEVSNPEILKVNPRVRSPYITENSSIEVTNQIKMLEKTAVTSGFASGKGNIDENSEQKADVSRKFEEYVHNKHEGLDMTEASTGLAINTEGSTREVAEENRSHVVEKIEEEKCNTDLLIKGNMNIVIPAYTQDDATEKLNEENESEKSNGKIMESEMDGEYESTLHKTNVDVERSIDALSMKQGESQLDESKNMAQMEAPAEGNRSVVILSAKETKDSDGNITSTMEKNLEIESQVEDDSEQSIHKYEHGQKVDDKLRLMINEETESEPSSKGTRNIACIKEEGATQNIAENSELEKEAKKANADSSDDTGEKVLKTTDAGQETKDHMLKKNENVKDHCPDFHDTEKCEERINQDQKFTEFEITPSSTYTRKEDMVEQERSLEEGTIGLQEDVNEEVSLKEESEKINLVRKTKPEDLEDCLEPNKDHNAKMTTEVSEEDIIAQESNKVAVQDSLYVPEVFEEVIGQEFLGRLQNESKYESMTAVVATKEAGLKEAEQEKEDKSQKSTVNTLVMQEENETKTTRNDISKENKTSSEIMDEIQADNNQEFSSVPSIERDLIEVKEIPDETASRDGSLLGKEGTPFSQLTKEEKSLQKEDEPKKLRDVLELGSSNIVKETTAGEIENQIDHELHIIPEVFESTKASQETIAPNGTTHHLLDFTDKKPTEENGNLDKTFAGIKAEPVSTKTEKQELKDPAISEASSSSTEKETAEEIPRKDAMNMEEEKGDKYLEFEEHIKSTNLIKEKIPETLEGCAERNMDIYTMTATESLEDKRYTDECNGILVQDSSFVSEVSSEVIKEALDKSSNVNDSDPLSATFMSEKTELQKAKKEKEDAMGYDTGPEEKSLESSDIKLQQSIEEIPKLDNQVEEVLTVAEESEEERGDVVDNQLHCNGVQEEKMAASIIIPSKDVQDKDLQDSSAENLMKNEGRKDEIPARDKTQHENAKTPFVEPTIEERFLEKEDDARNLKDISKLGPPDAVKKIANDEIQKQRDQELLIIVREVTSDKTRLESEDVGISNVKEAIQIACQNEMWKLETLEDTQLTIKTLDSIVIDIHMANQKASLKEIDSHSNSEGIIQGVEAEKAAVQLEANNTKNNEHLTEEELCRERSEENGAHRFEKSNETLPETKQQEKSNHQTCKMYPTGEVDPNENVSTKITTSRKDDPSPLQKEGPSDLKVSALPVERLDADKAEEQIRNTFGLVNDGKVVASMRKDEIIHNQIMLAEVSKDKLEVPPFTLLTKEQDQQTISTLKNIDKENAKEVELLDNNSTKYSSFTDKAKETSLQNEGLGNMETSDLIMQNMAVNETKKEIKDACETVSLSSTQSNEGGMIDKVVIDQKLLQGTLGKEVDVLPHMLLPSNYEDEAITITKKIEEEDMKEMKILGDNKSDYCSMEKTEDVLLQKEELKELQLSGNALETFCASKIEEKIKEVSIIEATYNSTKNVVVVEQDLPVEKGEIKAHFVVLSTKQLQLSSSALNIKEQEHQNIRVVDKVQEEKTKKEPEKLEVSKLEQRDGPNEVNEKESGTINEVPKVDTHKKEETRYFDSPSENKETTETRKEFVEACNFVSQIVQSNEVLTKTDDTESNGNHLNKTVMEDKEINKDTQTVPEIEENVSKGHQVESEPKENPEDKTNVIFESTINENQLKELFEEDEMRSLVGIIKKHVMHATNSDENDEKVYEKTKQISSIEENVKGVDHVKQELNIEILEENGAWSFEETNINPPDIKQKSFHATCEKHTPIEAYNKESTATQVTTYHKDVSPMLQDFIGKSTLTAEPTPLSLKTRMLVDTDIKGQEVEEEGGIGDSSETTIEMSPTMISLSKLMQRSMKETTPTSEHVIENIDARKSKVEQTQVENDDEGGGELKGEAIISYAPIAVESHQVMESRTKENLEEKIDLIFESTINENKLSELDELGNPIGKNEKHVMPAINSGENEEIVFGNTTKQNSPNEENVKEAVLVKQELITGVSEENYARCSEEANSPLDTKQQEESFHSTCEKHVLIEADNKENTPTQIIADHKNVSPMLQDSIGESTLTDEPTDIKPGNEMWIDTEITGQETAGEKGMGGSSETTEISPSMLSLSELMHASMKETIPKSEHVIEDTEATESKEAEQAQVTNDDERGEELKREAPITIENSGDVSVKVPHKKSHNILSGVSSKFKHSISKVKKVIACTSSHSKALSPKQNKKPDELID